MVAPEAAVADDAIRCRGTVYEVLYLGAETRFVVALEAGGRLIVSRPNTSDHTDAAPGSVVACHGARTTSAYLRSHDHKCNHKGEPMKHKRWLAGLAVSALSSRACGSDDDGGGGADTDGRGTRRLRRGARVLGCGRRRGSDRAGRRRG